MGKGGLTEERLPETGLGCCVYPGKVTLALTRLHKHVQYLTPAQFLPYTNMGGDFVSIY